MKVELKSAYSTPNPDDVAIMAARGDKMEQSLVGSSLNDVMKGTDRSPSEFIEEMLRRGHFGPFEHAQAFFAVEGLSRVAMAQVTRHRHMSFDVQSMRYVDFSNGDVVVPESITEAQAEDHIRRGQEVIDGERYYQDHIEDSVDRYQELVANGVPEEDARFVLPLGTKVNLTFSANLRSLMHFLDLRENMKAQWEAREFASEVREQMKRWAPLTTEAYEEHLNNNSLRAP